MAYQKNYKDRLDHFIPKTFFTRLNPDAQAIIRGISEKFMFTFQEFRQICEAAHDMNMWGESSLARWFQKNVPSHYSKSDKNRVFDMFKTYMESLRTATKSYPQKGLERPKKREKGKIEIEKSTKNVFGMCPVASEKTVCCNLKTIDAVENCVFGCSYCTIQTFYRDKTIFDDSLAEKLTRLHLDPDKQYHIGTGQSSDSLVWGNKNGNLDALCNFARNNPNVLLEFKTKSNNISYFLENDIPENIVCSWSLNPQIIIDNEEHFTASLENRLIAAKMVASQGIKIAFHFHPIVYYDNWKESYTSLAMKVQQMFHPDQVLFISFGSVTFIKPVLKKIRKQGFQTKITQMELVTDPHGKMTYPDSIKIEKFSTMYNAFSAWHNDVFFYLCMEKASLWEKSLGFVYPDNTTFEKAMLDNVFNKIYAPTVAAL